jgi:hypothetical protein
MKALAPDLALRYQRASDLLADVLALRSASPRPAVLRGDVGPPARAHDTPDPADVASRLRPREPPAPRFCWHCRKPLHARTDRCPFCGEPQ